MKAATLARRALKGASLFLVLALAIALLRAVEPSAEAYTRFVDENIRAHGGRGICLYISLTALLTCLAVPRQLLSLVGGYAFGAVAGALWATLGSGLGCVLSFFYSRLLAQSFVQKRFGRRIARLEAFLSRSPFVMTFIVRLMPVGNNLITNLAAGLTRIPPLPFFLGSVAGYVPQNFIFALLGSGVRVDPLWRTALSAALFALAAALGWWLYKKNARQID